MDKLDTLHTHTREMKQNRTSTQNKKRRLLRALEKTLATVQPACKMARVSRGTFYNWLKTDKQFEADYLEIKEGAIDFAEMSLMQQIAEHNTRATIFFLNNKGKHRGWGLDVARNANKVSKNYSDELEKMSDEELMAIINKEYKKNY